MSTVVAPRPPRTRRAAAVAVDGFFGSLSTLGRFTPLSRPGAHGVERLKDIPYTDSGERHHLLDVWRRPEHADAGRPCVLYVHGGAFQSLSKDSHWIMALAFARVGYVVFNINYRLAPTHPFPAALEDVCAAARWVHEHAAEYGGDPARFIFGGESAGANLVTSLAVCASWQRPEEYAQRVWDSGLAPTAVNASCGVLQVSDSARFARKRKLPWIVNARILDVEDCYLPHGPRELADPLLLLEADHTPERPLPPFFLPVGTADPLLDDTRRMAAALERRGVHHEAHYFKGEPHAFDALIFRKNARRCWQARFEFLDRVLGS
ncbi:MAG: alpha/beta hydrolase [Proteobacteria bacterium]|nr:alpha/beta hydrolase [Pseudomonadota bacterium]